MAVSKLVQQCARTKMIRSPFAYCMWIRYAARVIDDEDGLVGFVIVSWWGLTRLSIQAKSFSIRSH